MRAILFVDLDDTIFQTRLKNQDGFIPVTTTNNPRYTSFMTGYQNMFFDIFVGNSDIGIIPVTLRGVKEYNKTQVSKNPKIITTILYFGGLITEKEYADEAWSSHIRDQFANLKLPLGNIFKSLLENLKREIFTIDLVDSYYIAIKNQSDAKEVYTPQNKTLVNLIKSKIVNTEYFVHTQDRNVLIVPKFLDKKYAVKYLIDRYQPELTVGAGDSLSDWGFMELCDFKVIPSKSQLEEFLSSNIKI